MGILDGMKEMAVQRRENHIKVRVISGKQCFYLGKLENSVIIRQNERGYIYFDDIDGEYKIAGYEWGGPTYKSVTDVNDHTTTDGWSKSTSKGKEKRTGRLPGAAIGTLIMPGAGTLVGAMVGTGKKSQVRGFEKNHSTQDHTGKTVSYDEEVTSPAYMTLKDPKTQYSFTFSFECNSKTHGEILNLLHQSALEE